MGELHELSIKSVNVEIKVLRVDNHKMTKAVFRQIRADDIFDFNAIFQNDISEECRSSVLGYVFDDCKYIMLWVKDGELRAQEIEKSIPYSIRSSIVNSEGFHAGQGSINSIDDQYRKFHKLVLSEFDQIFIAT